MSFSKKTIRDVDVSGKILLIRVDYNVPLTESGEISDDYRLRQSLPTLEYLLDNGAALVLCSHLGRPKGRVNPAESLFPVAKRLQELTGRPVDFIPACVGERVEKAVAQLKPGGILLLENLRFYPEEEAPDAEFAKKLASYADIFVQDGFGVVHHPAVSVTEIPKYMPSVAGLLLEREVDTITGVMDNPERPLVAIIGGAKISDKIEVLQRFLDIADVVAIGGAMANTFLHASGMPVGRSKVEPADVPLAKEILHKVTSIRKDRNLIFYLPQDGVVAKKLDQATPTRIVDWSAHIIADIEAYPKRPLHSASQVADDEMILDIGPFSGAFIAGLIQLAGTVVWNGTMGVTETVGLQGPVGPTAHGTDLVMEAMLGQFGHRPFSLVGGGDTVGFVQGRGLAGSFDHVSTGGGASLELLSGRSLPGVDALEDKQS